MILKLCDVVDLPAEGELKAFMHLRPRPSSVLCVGMIEGRVYAVDDQCPHQRGSLSAGLLQGELVVCPLHSWKWNLITGLPIRPSDPEINSYEVRQFGDEAFVKIP